MNQTCKGRLARLRTILRETEPLRAQLCQIRRMREWVLQAEHILSGAWASTPDEIPCQEVGRRLDSWLQQVATTRQSQEMSPEEQRC